MWDAFWTGGISNPLEVLDQITYLMFLKRLDALPVFTPGTESLRWRSFSREQPEHMLVTVRDGVFPWLRDLGGAGSAYAAHMRDARFTIPTAGLLARAVEMIDDLPLDQRDTKGDLYEYMLGRIATAGQNGQFRTPRHIIELIVAMMAPGPDDVICDPACGSAGFLVAAAEHVGREHTLDAAQRRHFDRRMFHGFDFDPTMLRIASMNMLLHEVEQPDIRYRDSLAEPADPANRGRYSMILANPPFAGSLDDAAVAADLRQVVRTKKTELLFLALILRMLRPGGRAAVIVPEGVLFGSGRAHRDLRRLLVEEHRLEAVVKLPGGVFRPYAGVSTAILFFTRTDRGGTDRVWFYELAADGFSLDDRRLPLIEAEKLGARPAAPLTEGEHDRNNLPDLLARWARRDAGERDRARTEQSFSVPRGEIQEQGYDLSVNRYKKVVHAEPEHRPPAEILADLERLEAEIADGLAGLRSLLG